MAEAAADVLAGFCDLLTEVVAVVLLSMKHTDIPILNLR